MDFRSSSLQNTNSPMRIARRFGDLRIRPKLVVLHNIFFFTLSVSVYLAVIPTFSQRIAEARARELDVVTQVFAANLPLKDESGGTGRDIYNYREGLSRDLGLSATGQQFLATHPTETWQQGKDTLFRAGRIAGEYRRINLPRAFYEDTVRQARVALLLVLGAIYLLTVAALEWLIMPQYVYRPIRLMLDADAATQRGDRAHELIDAVFINDDEIGQIMASRNLTVAELRRHEDQLASALRQLEEQDRLVSLGLLSTSVAHELNTPLAVLQGSIEKLRETSREAITCERLDRMLRVTQRLRKISESLLDFARVRKDRMERVLLRPLLDESWALVAIDEKAAEVSFTNRISPAVAVAGNPDRLIQVFVNLLRNALNAVPGGGAIFAEAKALQQNGRAWVCCSVLDNGPGIPLQVLPNLFEAFVTTRLDARGTGLGLTVAEGIVTQHGGTIAAANRPEGGAALEVVLPASE